MERSRREFCSSGGKNRTNCQSFDNKNTVLYGLEDIDMYHIVYICYIYYIECMITSERSERSSY